MGPLLFDADLSRSCFADVSLQGEPEGSPSCGTEAAAI